jgi:hypothetical protein
LFKKINSSSGKKNGFSKENNEITNKNNSSVIKIGQLLSFEESKTEISFLNPFNSYEIEFELKNYFIPIQYFAFVASSYFLKQFSIIAQSL